MACVSLACRPADPIAEIRELHTAGRYPESLGQLRTLVEEAPDDAELNQLYGEALLATGQPQLAVWPLRRAAEAPGREVAAGLLLAEALSRSTSYADAAAAATRVLEREPGNRKALELRARSYVAARREQEALADLEHALELAPDDPDLLATRLRALIGLKRVEEAEEALAALRTLLEETGAAEPLRARLCAASATFAHEQANPERAEGIHESCLTEFPADPTVLQEALGFFDAQSRPERSLEILQLAVEAAPHQLGLRVALSERLRLAGREQEGEQILLEETVDFESPMLWTALSDLYMATDRLTDARSALERALEITPDPPPFLRFAHAEVVVMLGDYEAAEALLDEIETPVYRHLLRGRMELQQGNAAAALQSLEAGLRLWPDQPLARFHAGQAAERVGDFARAVNHYRESIRADAALTDAGLELATLLEAQGSNDALGAIQRYVRAHPSDPRGYPVLVRVARRQGNDEMAAKAFAQWSELPDETPSAIAARAELAREEAGPTAAIRGIEAQKLDLTSPQNTEVLRVLAASLSARGDGAAALALVETALAAHPEEARFHVLHGRMLRASGASQSAEEAFERALELDPENARALTSLAELAATRGESASALALYERAALADREAPAPAFAAAVQLWETRQTAEAEARLERVLDAHPRHAAAALELASLRLERGGDLAEAEALAERAVLFGAGGRAQETLGRIRLARGDAEGAAAALRAALALEPEAASVHYALGRALLASGDAEAARGAFRRALASSPFPEAEQARAELAKLEAGGNDATSGPH